MGAILRKTLAVALLTCVWVSYAVGQTPPASTRKASGADADTAAKLKILEQLRQTGVLDEKEYETRKARLLAGQRAAPAADPATQQKLSALDAARKAGILDDQEYARKREQILGGGGAAGPAAPRAGGTSKPYRHPIGFQFLQPADWQVREQGEALQLIPPNPGSDSRGPTEIYMITGERTDTEGIRGADDPRVGQFLDEQVKRLSPALSRSGAPTPVATSTGKGVVYQWSARSPEGKEIQARAFVNVLNGYGLILLAIGHRERLAAREPVLEQMFVSFGMGASRIEPELVGRWALVSNYALTNWSVNETAWSRARMASETKSVLTLQPDGAWTRIDDRETLAGAGGVWLENKSRDSSRGRWYAGNGFLYRIWENDSWNTYKYAIQATPEGRQLRLATEKEGTLWREIR